MKNILSRDDHWAEALPILQTKKWIFRQNLLIEEGEFKHISDSKVGFTASNCHCLLNT